MCAANRFLPPLCAAWLVAFVLVSATGSPAHADSGAAAAREHFRKATALYDTGNYAAAVEEYKLAFEAKEDVARRTP